MNILTLIIMFIISSVNAALDGDYSGTNFIGKVLLGIGIFFIIACILTGFTTEGSGKIFLISIIISIIGGLLSAKKNKR